MTPLPRLGCLISQHPAINHAMILREVRCLRKHFNVQVASIRAPDRPLPELTEEERNEAAATYYVNPQGISTAARAHFVSLFSSTINYIAGFVHALKLAGPHPKKAFFYFGYFTQALMVGQWMKRHKLLHLHVHYSSTVGLLVQRVFRIGLSISFHGPDEFNDPIGFRLREKVHACQFVRAISYYARSQLMMASDPADWDKIKVVYMGVDPALFAPRTFRQAPDPVELICVGRLAPVKAQRLLLDAMNHLVQQGKNILLHVVGGGPDRQALEHRVIALDLQRHVILHGFTPQAKLEELYRRTDIFTLASFAEGVPGVLMEAMAMEIPCVSTWITGIPELIRENGLDGLMVAPSDAQGLANAIAALIDNPELRHQLGRAGRQRILRDFDLLRNAGQIAQIFRAHIR